MLYLLFLCLKVNSILTIWKIQALYGEYYLEYFVVFSYARKNNPEGLAHLVPTLRENGDFL
jgi:hypothetical protein